MYFNHSTSFLQYINIDRINLQTVEFNYLHQEFTGLEYNYVECQKCKK